MEHFQHQSSKHIPMSETILETIRTLNAQSNKYITSQKEVAFSYALDAKNLATSYLSQLGTNSELPISTSIDDESFVVSVKKELVNALSTLAHIYNTSGEVDNSKEIILQGISLAEECKMEFHHAQFLLNLGNCFFRTSFMMEALENYEQSLEKLEYLNTKESILLKSKVLNNIGNVYNKLNDNSASLEYYHKVLEIKNTHNLPEKNFILTYLNLGMAYAAIGKLDVSLEYYEECVLLSNEHNDKKSLALVYNNLGNHWSFQGEFEKSLNFFQESIALKKSLNYDYGLDTSYYNIAIVLGQMKRFKEANNFLEEALQLAKKNLNTDLIGDIFLYFAEINSVSENPYLSLDFATECLQQIENLPTVIEQKDVQSDMYRIKSNIEKLRGNFANSLDLFQNHSKLERELELEQFKIQEQLLRDQIAYERKKSKEVSTNEFSIQLEALRKENSNLSELLDKTKENVTTLLEQKNDLIRMASHDLKNPLNNILGFAEYLLKEIPTISYDEIKEYATYIRDSAQRMTTIITTILDVNKTGASSINVTLQKTDVATIVQTLLKEYSQYANSKNITISQNIQAQKSICETDADLLKQIIDNIYSNAIKYSPLGSNVRITVRSQDNIVTIEDQQTVESVVIVEIEDKGPGFTEDDRINMFGTYAKLSAKPTAGEHSTGLGLSIVKKLSELINVTVWCESTVGEGSTFFIEIPEFHKPQ